MTAIELVTADGDLIRTDATHEPELFWALRGGGGTFGVITAIEFAVFPITAVYAGALFFPYERAGEIVRVWRDSLPAMPEAMTSWTSLLNFPDLPFVPRSRPTPARSMSASARRTSRSRGVEVDDLPHVLVRVAEVARIDTPGPFMGGAEDAPPGLGGQGEHGVDLLRALDDVPQADR